VEAATASCERIYMTLTIALSLKCIYKALLTLADVTMCLYRNPASTPNRKQCRCRIIVARKNFLERQKHSRKKPREEPGSEGSSFGCAGWRL
jgi:hypothetical protein